LAGTRASSIRAIGSVSLTLGLVLREWLVWQWRRLCRLRRQRLLLIQPPLPQRPTCHQHLDVRWTWYSIGRDCTQRWNDV